MLKGLRWNTYNILQDKSFVEYFDEEITILLEEQQYGLQFVVSYYLEEHDKKLQVYIPRHFTIEKRVKLIEDYLKSDYINPNFMKLILNTKLTNELTNFGRIINRRFFMTMVLALLLVHLKMLRMSKLKIVNGF